MRENKKNILFITCDQLRADYLGCYGNGIVKTPHIDALAQRGMLFDQMITAYPICAPNRATLATGRYPSVHGLNRNGIILPKNEVTLMETLRQVGYVTAGVGKMHFGPQWAFPPEGGSEHDPMPALAINPQPDALELPWYGFEEVWLTEDNRVGPYGDYLQEHGYDVWADPHSFSYPQHQTVRSQYPVEHHQATWIADRSIDFLAKQTEQKPFFLWTSFVGPHHPFVVPAPYDTMYDPDDMPLPIFSEVEFEYWPDAYRSKQTKTEGSHEAIGMNRLSDDEWKRIRAFYCGMITQIDDQVGRIIEVLKIQGLYDNTLIVFTSDHGEMLGDHHLVFKGTTFDEVVRVPFILSHSSIPEASCEGLCSSTDVMPTLLDMADVDVPAGVQGVSLAPCIKKPSTPLRSEVLIETSQLQRALRTETCFISWHGPGRQGELYDLFSDPHQQDNLWGRPEFAELQDEMMGRLMESIVLNSDPLFERVGFC